MQPGRAELLVEQGVDEGAGVLVVDDRDDELHARSIAPRAESTPGQRVFGGVYDAASDRHECVQESPCPPTDRPAIPARPSPAAIAAVAGADDLDAALAAVLAAADAAFAPAMAAVLVRTRTGPACSSSPRTAWTTPAG